MVVQVPQCPSGRPDSRQLKRYSLSGAIVDGKPLVARLGAGKVNCQVRPEGGNRHCAIYDWLAGLAQGGGIVSHTAAEDEYSLDDD
jgi:hypothetical protein